MKTSILVLVAWAALAGMPASAAETGTALKADDLRLEPYADAKTVGRLQAGDKVSVLNRSGGWLQVQIGKTKGWVRMLSIRKGAAVKRGNEAAGLLQLASGRAGTGKVVAATGVRGLSEEELKSASFNEAEVATVESYSVSKADAAAAAQKKQLVARPFDYLPEVK